MIRVPLVACRFSYGRIFGLWANKKVCHDKALISPRHLTVGAVFMPQSFFDLRGIHVCVVPH